VLVLLLSAALLVKHRRDRSRRLVMLIGDGAGGTSRAVAPQQANGWASSDHGRITGERNDEMSGMLAALQAGGVSSNRLTDGSEGLADPTCVRVHWLVGSSCCAIATVGTHLYVVGEI
jgi:hypothetical protein